MPDPSGTEEIQPVATLESLPPGGLSPSHIETLDESDALDFVTPLVVDTTTNRVTHLSLVRDGKEYYLGWDPVDEQWEKLLVAVETGEGLAVAESVVVYDDADEVELAFDPGTDTESGFPEIAEFVREYVEHTYPETDHLHNLMDTAMEMFPPDDE